MTTVSTGLIYNYLYEKEFPNANFDYRELHQFIISLLVICLELFCGGIPIRIYHVIYVYPVIFLYSIVWSLTFAVIGDALIKVEVCVMSANNVIKRFTVTDHHASRMIKCNNLVSSKLSYGL